ncbi:MAG: YggT family protein [Candidatus Omnitrophica bacterium]|nr:YggT family protein [Candidatus Omnitrophota bacterium]
MVGIFFDSLIWLVNTIFFILYIAIIARIVLSWVGADSYNSIVQIVYSISEPLLAPFRRLPLQFGGLDFSPLLVFFVLKLLNGFIVRAIFYIYSLFN